jgi:hypothetical protein
MFSLGKETESVSATLSGRILWPRRNEVTGEWRRLRNEKLYAVYLLPYIRVINSRRMRWTRHVALMGKGRGLCRV